MTALLTDEEIIQRYTPDEGYGGPYLLSSDDGDAVLYTDHIAAMQRGQEVRAQLVEALEWCRRLMEEEPKPLTHTNAYAMTVAALAAAKEIK